MIQDKTFIRIGSPGTCNLGDFFDGSSYIFLGPATGAKSMETTKKPQKSTIRKEELLSGSMGYLVRRTFRAFTRVLEQRLVAEDISISMWFFLRLLWEGDERNQKEISDELGLTPPTTVSAMDNLEKRGLIVRKRNPQDRREILIC